MILDIPVTFTALVIRPRHRNPEQVGVRTSIPVKIPELTSADAPLAALCTDPEGRRLPFYFDRGALGGPRLVAPWRPHREWATAEESWRTVRGDALQAWLAEGKRNPFTPKDPRSGEDIRHDTAIGLGTPVREWVSSDREKVTAHVLAQADRAVIVDGVLCMVSDGPSWRILHQDHHQEPATHIRACPDFEASSDDRAREYRGDRLADALAHAVALRQPRARHVDPAAVAVDGAIDVRIPEALTVDDDWRALTTNAKALLKDNADRVHTWPRAAGLAYFDLRDALARATDGFDAEALAPARLLARASRDRAVGYMRHGERLAETVDRLDRGRAAAPAPAGALAPR